MDSICGHFTNMTIGFRVRWSVKWDEPPDHVTGKCDGEKMSQEHAWRYLPLATKHHEPLRFSKGRYWAEDDGMALKRPEKTSNLGHMTAFGLYFRISCGFNDLSQQTPETMDVMTSPRRAAIALSFLQS
jgi:hypothetical protein